MKSQQPGGEPTHKKALLIVNPTAGHSGFGNLTARSSQNDVSGSGKAGELHDLITSAFHEISYDLIVTQRRGDAERAANEAAVSQSYGSVIVAGGDGTVNEVANGLLTGAASMSTSKDASVTSPIPLGIVPIGTQNVLASELGMQPGNIRDAAAAVISGHTRTIDVGEISGRYFVLMAGFGFDAVVVRDVQKPIKELVGPAAYAFATLSAITKYNSTAMSIVLDDEPISTRAFLLVVANAASYAYHQVKMAPFASLDDGWLDICVFEKPPTDRFGFATQVAALFAGRHLRDPRVRYYRARTIAINSLPPVAVQLDGDPFGTTPVSISVCPRALRVFAP